MSKTTKPVTDWWAVMHGNALYGVCSSQEAAQAVIDVVPKASGPFPLYTDAHLESYAAARVAEALEASGWQPIDTAPRDGTEFQAWAFGGWETRCRIDPETEEFQVWNRSEYDQEGWASIPREKVRAWMPQPAAPNTHPA